MSFVLTKGTLRDAAQDVRTAQVQLDLIVQQLDAAHVWTGPDADRFAREWQDRVRGPLQQSASLLDGVSYITLL